MTMMTKQRREELWVGCSDALGFPSLICTIDKQLAGIQIYASKTRPPVNRNLECFGPVTRVRGNRLLDPRPHPSDSLSIVRLCVHFSSRKNPAVTLSDSPRPIQIHSGKSETTYQVKALFRFRRFFTSGACYGCGRAIGLDFICRFFRPRYEVGWIPDGRFPFVSVELGAVLFFFYRVRSSGTYITSGCNRSSWLLIQ